MCVLSQSFVWLVGDGTADGGDAGVCSTPRHPPSDRERYAEYYGVLRADDGLVRPLRHCCASAGFPLRFFR